ncbi:MAG: FtsW/RodA/SpoVE family cell cycle protein [Erysipelothrix sp.]|nr:FtsW/RodA/SpoVE family cell cycle protein [Erysipelothrix sp.]
MKSILSLKLPISSNKIMHTWVILFSLYGSLMVVSASMNSTTTLESLVSVIIRQMAFLALGTLFMIKVSQWMNYELLKKYIFIISIVMIGALILPLMYAEVGGARAWIRLPAGFTIQPSEFAKILIILLFAMYGGDVNKTKTPFYKIIGWPILFTLIYVGIVLFLQRDLGSAVIMLVLGWMSMMLLSGPWMKWVKFWMFILTLMGIGGVLFLLTPQGVAFLSRLPIPSYQVNRFIDMLNPVERRYDSSYQLFNSLIAFSKGELWGIGLGQSVQKLGYLPVATSDYILAVIVEETGIIGFGVVLMSYVSLCIMLMGHALSVQQEKFKIIIFGNMMFLMLHFILNVGGVSATIPLTGIPLLMVSAGGSSQLAIMVMFGLSQNAIHRDKSERIRINYENNIRKPSILKTTNSLLSDHSS